MHALFVMYLDKHCKETSSSYEKNSTIPNIFNAVHFHNKKNLWYHHISLN